MDKYTQLYKKKLETILSSYTIPVTNVVFAKDSPSRSQLWRTQEYPESTTIFKRNEQLIDMTKVPESLLTVIQQTLKPIVKPIIKPIVDTNCDVKEE